MFISSFLIQVFILTCAFVSFAQSQKQRVGVSLSKHPCKIPWVNRTIINIASTTYFTDKNVLKSNKQNRGDPSEVVVYEASPRALQLYKEMIESSGPKGKLDMSAVQRNSLEKGRDVVKLFQEHYKKNKKSKSNGNSNSNSNSDNKSNSNHHKLLCVAFVKASLEPTINLRANVAHMGRSCDWAIIIYKEDQSQLTRGVENFAKQICKTTDTMNTNIIFCGMTKYTDVYSSYMQEFNLSSAGDACGPIKLGKEHYIGRDHKVLNIPKSVLYVELIEYLPNYNYVMMLDEDISLLDVNMTKFIDIWMCSPSSYPPLIVQPLIAENTQYYSFLNEESWRNSDIIYSESGLVEQQVPVMASMFLYWYITEVLKNIVPCALLLGVDWGIDRTWCPAAKQFGQEVLGWRGYKGSCGIIIGSGPAHHLNTQAITSKRKYPGLFRARGQLILDTYNALFPSWVGTYDYNFVSPSTNSMYKRTKKIRAGCLNKYRSSNSSECIPGFCHM